MAGILGIPHESGLALACLNNFDVGDRVSSSRVFSFSSFFARSWWALLAFFSGVPGFLVFRLLFLSKSVFCGGKKIPRYASQTLSVCLSVVSPFFPSCLCFMSGCLSVTESVGLYLYLFPLCRNYLGAPAYLPVVFGTFCESCRNTSRYVRTAPAHINAVKTDTDTCVVFVSRTLCCCQWQPDWTS